MSALVKIQSVDIPGLWGPTPVSGVAGILFGTQLPGTNLLSPTHFKCWVCTTTQQAEGCHWGVKDGHVSLSHGGRSTQDLRPD